MLSEKLILKNHPFRHAIEKEQRHELSLLYLNSMNWNENSINDFFDEYSNFCGYLVNLANKGLVKKDNIEMDELMERFNLKGQHKIAPNNFVNRFMSYLHS